MALATTIDWADATRVEYDRTRRNLREAGESSYNYIEDITTIVLEVLAVTEAAAQTEIDLNTQPSAPATGVQSYSYDGFLQDEIVNGWTVRRTDILKVVDFP